MSTWHACYALILDHESKCLSFILVTLPSAALSSADSWSKTKLTKLDIITELTEASF
jgi:hypothetical protein